MATATTTTTMPPQTDTRIETQQPHAFFSTSRLSFTLMSVADALLLQELRKDPAVMKWSRQGRPDVSFEETEDWIRTVTGIDSPASAEEGEGQGQCEVVENKEKKKEPQTRKTQGKCFIFSVREKTQAQAENNVDESVIATVGIRETDSPLSPGKIQFELGYMFVSRVWGRGLASEAVRGMTGWWFEYSQSLKDSEEGEQAGGSDMSKVYAVVAKANGASMRVMEKCGFRVVGEGVDDEDDGSGKEIVEFCMSAP